MAKNPPPAPLLQSLADTPQKQREVQELRIFLILLWEQLGGGDDSIDAALRSALMGAADRARIPALYRRIDELEAAVAALQTTLRRRDEDALKLAIKR